MLHEKNIPKLMIIVPVVSVVLLTALITYFYISNRHQHFKIESERLKQEYIKGEKLQIQKRLSSLNALIETKFRNMEKPMSDELVSRVNVAYDTAHYLHDRYSKGYNEKAVKGLILGTLSRMEWNNKQDFIWVMDKKGNNLLTKQQEYKKNILDYKDADGREIIKEQIEAVDKYKDAFIKTRLNPQNPKIQLMYLKDFGIYDWYFGTGMYYFDEYERIKKNIIMILSAVQSDPDEYYYIVNSSGNVIYHPEMELNSNVLDLKDKNGFAFIKEQIHKSKTYAESNNTKIQEKDYVTYLSKSRLYQEVSEKITYSTYFKPFDWIITTGFYTLNIQDAISKQQGKLKEEIDAEIRTILIYSFILAIFVILLTLGFSRSISEIFLDYKKRVKNRENELKELNDSLVIKVKEEVNKQREKEKMLIQQSKMAAMGDMISMIAHQWRQPLNQMSFVMMNIDGAYDERTLSRDYLDTKLKEGEKLLEYMSHTIDDFRNFFKPDKEKEEIELCVLVDLSIGLIEKGLEKLHVELFKNYDCDKKVKVYKNEMTQVLLNLLKNAQEALEDIEGAKIIIDIYEEDTEMKIAVSDNGGGVNSEHLEKIFEPYFSTKQNQGTGLGLYMSKMIIQEHMEGNLHVQNVDGGASFIISLPYSCS